LPIFPAQGLKLGCKARGRAPKDDLEDILGIMRAFTGMLGLLMVIYAVQHWGGPYAVHMGT